MPRAVDRAWEYARVVPVSVAGFNPFRDAIYYGSHSALAGWVADPRGPTRARNPNDRLVRELLFALHDYLHLWSTVAIQNLAPELGFAHAPIDARNVERHAYCMLLAEAVATAGLDYWYLSTIDLNDVCDLGTTVRGLAVSYHEAHAREFRRFASGFVIQRPEFLAELTRFYCDGVWSGFSASDLQCSPLLMTWLNHELRYGERQRVITRSWLRHLSREHVLVAPSLAAPVRCDEPWQRALAAAITELLWAKIKHDELERLPRLVDPEDAWRAPPHKQREFQFINANVVAGGFDGLGDESAAHLAFQLVSRCKMADVDPLLCESLRPALLRHDYPFVKRFVERAGAMSALPGEPRDLLTLN
ncbi:MAG TPA: hypothetical protein VG755_24445 [Nannocystaceae bacterium]|nr:hypothetical protein [Nannocystaceae bacterium]